MLLKYWKGWLCYIDWGHPKYMCCSWLQTVLRTKMTTNCESESLGKSYAKTWKWDANHLCWLATHWQQPGTWCKFNQSCFIVLLIDGEKCVMFAAFLCCQIHHDKAVTKTCQWVWLALTATIVYLVGLVDSKCCLCSIPLKIKKTAVVIVLCMMDFIMLWYKHNRTPEESLVKSNITHYIMNSTNAESKTPFNEPVNGP